MHLQHIQAMPLKQTTIQAAEVLLDPSIGTFSMKGGVPHNRQAVQITGPDATGFPIRNLTFRRV
jgi:hypothetical protein